MHPYSEEGTFLEKPAPQPSIQVGAQVRLTGVVTYLENVAGGNGCGVLLTGGEHDSYLSEEERQHIEVIRQPFKRGEVVYALGLEESPHLADFPWLVVVDENAVETGMVTLADANGAPHTVDATRYERRP